MIIAPHVDFEGNRLQLGDEVLTCDLDKQGGVLRRGEVVKLCPSSVRVCVKRVSLIHGDEGEQEILRDGSWIALISRNPAREAELTNGPTIEL